MPLSFWQVAEVMREAEVMHLLGALLALVWASALGRISAMEDEAPLALSAHAEKVSGHSPSLAQESRLH